MEKLALLRLSKTKKNRRGNRRFFPNVCKKASLLTVIPGRHDDKRLLRCCMMSDFIVVVDEVVEFPHG